MNYNSVEISKKVNIDNTSRGYNFELNLNVLPFKPLYFSINYDLCETNLSSVKIYQIGLSEVENFKNHFDPLSHTSTIKLCGEFIYIKYPNSTIYEKINWHRLKNIYKNNSNDLIIVKLLYAISSLRKLTMIIIKNILFDNFINSCYNEAGSTNLTSDLDFSYIDLSRPYLSVTMMDMFYKIVRSIYDDESCNVFDINYYICSSFFSAGCYNNIIKPKPMEIINVTYGITLLMIQRLFNLFNICTESVFKEFLNIGINEDLSDTSLRSVYFCQTNSCDISKHHLLKSLDKFFLEKTINTDGTDKTIYYLDFPELDNIKFPDYKKYLLMDLHFDIAIISNCINDLIKKLSDFHTTTISVSASASGSVASASGSTSTTIFDKKSIIHHDNKKRYKSNLIYSQAYYNILNSIKESTDKYCSNDIRFKVIIMLKCLMSLMSASANESYISDIAVSLVVYKFKLNLEDPFIEFKRFIAFMDNFRFILEWYHLFLIEEQDDSSKSIAKYKFFDSVCKYFVRILALDAEYKDLINSVIDEELLTKYNSLERANGKLISHAENLKKNYLKDYIYNYTEHQRSKSIVELPFELNPIITETYTKLKHKNLYTIIEPFIIFYYKHFNKINSSVLDTATSVFFKINSILNIDNID